MNINIIIFGKLKDITGTDSIQITEARDTDEMIALMNKRFPGLAKMQYAVAVGKDIIVSNTALHENDTIALLPPYSGG